MSIKMTWARRVPCPFGESKTSPCQASLKPTTSKRPSSTYGGVKSLCNVWSQENILRFGCSKSMCTKIFYINYYLLPLVCGLKNNIGKTFFEIKYFRICVWSFTSRLLCLFGVPHGFNPPEKLGKLRHTMDLMLYVKWKEC